jgi:hypothetical protein
MTDLYATLGVASSPPSTSPVMLFPTCSSPRRRHAPKWLRSGLSVGCLNDIVRLWAAEDDLRHRSPRPMQRNTPGMAWPIADGRSASPGTGRSPHLSDRLRQPRSPVRMKHEGAHHTPKHPSGDGSRPWAKLRAADCGDTDVAQKWQLLPAFYAFLSRGRSGRAGGRRVAEGRHASREGTSTTTALAQPIDWVGLARSQSLPAGWQ